MPKDKYVIQEKEILTWSFKAKISQLTIKSVRICGNSRETIQHTFDAWPKKIANVITPNEQINTGNQYESSTLINTLRFAVIR